MINWREIPFVRLLIPFIGGILLGTHFNTKIPYLYFVFAVLTGVLFLLTIRPQQFSYRWVFGMFAFLLFTMTGYQLTIEKYAPNKTHHLKNSLPAEEDYFIKGIITEEPGDGEWTKVLLKTKAAGEEIDSLRPVSGRLLVYIENGKNANLAYGDALIIKTAIQEIPPPKNPHAFDYKRYLQFKNITHQAFVRNGQWYRIAKGQGNPVIAMALQARQYCLNIFKKYLKNENELAVAAALVLGHKEEITDEIRDAYAATGAMHVLAVSGLHVGLIFFFLELLFRLIRTTHRHWKLAKILISLAGIWSFALLTGASPSVLRAATMFSFLVIGKHIRRYTNIYNTLAASAFCLLLFNPFLLLQVGFQLSYLAVTSIIYFQPKIYRLWIIDNKIGDHFWTLTSVAIAAQIGTFPISIFYFHQFPVHFWLSAVVVVDAAGIVLGLSFLLFFFESVFPIIGSLFGYVLNGVIWLVNTFIFQIQQLPFSHIQGIWFSGEVVLLFYLTLLAIAIAIYNKNSRMVLFSASAVCFIAVFMCWGKYCHFHENEVVVYHIKGGTVMDIMFRDSVYAVRSDEISAQAVQYAAQQHRWAKAKYKLRKVPLSDTSLIYFTGGFKKGPFIHFNKKRFLFLHKTELSTAKPEQVDFLILCNNVKVNLERLKTNFKAPLIIADCTNYFSTIKRWKTACDTLGLDFYDIRSQGAFIFNFENEKSKVK